MISHDPIEDDPAVKAILPAVDKEAEALVKKRSKRKKGQMGYCHLFWSAKQEILRKKYGIEWKSPQELNPGTKYD
ncbi:MAG: hypothetical protein Q6373_003355 [Candidatus Sigynarchaeota archaeon]